MFKHDHAFNRALVYVWTAYKISLILSNYLKTLLVYGIQPMLQYLVCCSSSHIYLIRAFEVETKQYDEEI